MISLRGVSKQFDGKRKVTALDHVDLDDRARRDGLHRGAVGLGEIDAAESDRRSGPAHARAKSSWTEPRSSRLSDDDLTRVRRDKIGFIFQFFNLLPTLSCLENVSLPLHLRGWPRKKIEERAQGAAGSGEADRATGSSAR